MKREHKFLFTFARITSTKRWETKTIFCFFRFDASHEMMLRVDTIQKLLQFIDAIKFARPRTG